MDGGGGGEISGLEAAVSVLSALLDGFEAVPFVFHPISGDVISSILLVKDPNYEARLPIIDITFNGSIADSSRRSAVITNHNVTLNSDNIGGLFDSSDSAYLELPSVAGDLSGDFTIEMWVNASDAATNKALFAAEGDCRIGINIMNGYWSMWAGEGESWNIMQCDDEYGYTPYGSSDTAPTLNTWTHIAMVHKETAYTLYVNGTSAKSVTASGNVAIGSAHYLIGAWGNSSDRMFFDGQMKQLKVYNYAKYDSSFTPPTPPQPTPDIPTSGLVFYAPLSASALSAETGQELTDESYGEITYVTDDNKHCAQWGQYGGTITIDPIFPTAQIDTGKPCTASVWVKVEPNRQDGNHFFCIAPGTSGNASTGLFIGGNSSRWAVYSGGTYSIQAPIGSLSGWTHLCFTNDVTDIMMYENGQYVTNGAAWDIGQDGRNPYLGESTYSEESWIFKMMAVRLYDRVLTQAEITALANEFTPSQS